MTIGKILGFTAHYGSGVAHIELEVEGVRCVVACENAPTVRALNAIYPCVNGHSVLVNELIGKFIWFELNDFGMLGSISEEI